MSSSKPTNSLFLRTKHTWRQKESLKQL